MPDPKTEELSTEQVRREMLERERAQHAEQKEEEHTASRRAEKAAYLKKKLGDRAASEDEQR
jgi:hypothetical protein